MITEANAKEIEKETGELLSQIADCASTGASMLSNEDYTWTAYKFGEITGLVERLKLLLGIKDTNGGKGICKRDSLMKPKR